MERRRDCRKRGMTESCREIKKEKKVVTEESEGGITGLFTPASLIHNS